MRYISTMLVISTILISCNRDEKHDPEYVLKKFEEYSGKIEKVEYNIRCTDTFPDGLVWNNNGYAFIERDTNDTLFGFSFYGKRNDISKEYIYDKGLAFIIDSTNGRYSVEKGDYGFLGRPGGQMISKYIFRLDSIYKSVVLTYDNEYYVLEFLFSDDTLLNVTDIAKTVRLRKDDFFPAEVVHTYNFQGQRSFSRLVLSNIRINEQSSKSVAAFKSKLNDLELIRQEKTPGNRWTGKKLPPVILPDLLNERDTVHLDTHTPILLDFWEAWCGHCIASLPQVEELKNKYGEDLTVTGIVSQDKESAVDIIRSGKITFTNLSGNHELLQTLGVNSFPRYFLIDDNGVIQKEYYGFSDQMEKDINEMIWMKE